MRSPGLLLFAAFGCCFAADDDLVGTSWTATDVMNNSETLEPILDATLVTARFGEDGFLTGVFWGCTDLYELIYASSEQDVSIVDSEYTDPVVECDDVEFPDSVPRQEKAYRDALYQAVSYRIINSGEKLELMNGDGLVVASFRSCNSGPLAGTGWHPTVIHGENDTIINDKKMSLKFGDCTLSGSAGCNGYSGDYKANDSNIVLGPISVTLMECLDKDVMELENTYLGALNQATAYDIEGDDFKLLNEEGSDLISFVRCEPPALTNITWFATLINNKFSFTGAEITATFGEDGVLRGSGGCNSYWIDYEMNVSSIQLGLATTTDVACEPAIMEQERNYLAALQRATTVEVMLCANVIVLRDNDGSHQVTFNTNGMDPDSTSTDSNATDPDSTRTDSNATHMTSGTAPLLRLDLNVGLLVVPVCAGW